MALPAALRGPWDPFRITGTPMPPALLLLCKLLATAILTTEHFRILPSPFLPFIPGLDQITDPRSFQITLQTVCVVAALALLFNRSVRASALILGSCLLLGVVASKGYYGNNKTFVGLSLVLAGLSDFDRPPYLLRWQFSLVYFGAALNKIMDEDWQSGWFFANWAGARIRNPVYDEIAVWLSPLLAGWLMCWTTIVAEFLVAFALFVPRLVPLALWTNALFQMGLLQFTGGTFTLFFYAMQAAALAFVTWPTDLEVLAPGAQPGWRRWLRWLDPDGLQHWQSDNCARQLGVVEGERACWGWSAFSRLLLWSPVLWLTATVLLARAQTPWQRRVLVLGVFLLVLPAFWRGRPVARREHSPERSPESG